VAVCPSPAALDQIRTPSAPSTQESESNGYVRLLQLLPLYARVLVQTNSKEQSIILSFRADVVHRS